MVLVRDGEIFVFPTAVIPTSNNLLFVYQFPNCICIGNSGIWHSFLTHTNTWDHYYEHRLASGFCVFVDSRLTEELFFPSDVFVFSFVDAYGIRQMNSISINWMINMKYSYSAAHRLTEFTILCACYAWIHE